MNLLTQTTLLVCVFFCEIFAQRSWILWMQHNHVSQVQKAYGVHVDDEIKSKVPSMGGVVFVIIGVGLFISSIIQKSIGGILFWTYPLLSAFVGLSDDLLKYTHKSSEGLRSMQKFYLQLATTVIWFFMLAVNGKIPTLIGSISIGHLIWPVALFFAVGVQNAVNVTDGLDGLAAGASAISFAFFCVISAESFGGAIAGLAMSLGFLWHNCHPAQVFMGDAGAHFLAGLMASCAFLGLGGVLSLIPACILFGIEVLSVVIQLIAIHKFNRKVFLMSPIHHHFQKLGWKEDKIVIRFWLIQLLGAVLCGALFCSLFLKSL